ncbi:MAG TPA: hypothetical protein VJ729_17555 [Nitrososphaeraceae archaeon]|nr:hypothetical protein [Nitrososphaeraceae archaeon]
MLTRKKNWYITENTVSKHDGLKKSNQSLQLANMMRSSSINLKQRRKENNDKKFH